MISCSNINNLFFTLGPILSELLISGLYESQIYFQSSVRLYSIRYLRMRAYCELLRASTFVIKYFHSDIFIYMREALGVVGFSEIFSRKEFTRRLKRSYGIWYKVSLGLGLHIVYGIRCLLVLDFI